MSKPFLLIVYYDINLSARDSTYSNILPSRYLCWLEAYLTNIELSHPGASNLLESGAISVARSLIPGARSAVDKTMEETFMRFSKASGKSQILSMIL